MRAPRTLPSLLLLAAILAVPPAGADPKVTLTLPYDMNLHPDPIVRIEGTVENSLTHPGHPHDLIRCRVWFSVAGRPWRLARTASNGPDGTVFAGRTGEAAIFKGVEDLFPGTQSVSVYAIDDFGRRSATVTRTVVYEKPRIPEAAVAFAARLDRLAAVADRVRNLETDDESDVIERHRLVEELGEQLGRELVFSEYRNYEETRRRAGIAAEPRVRYALVETVERARRYFVGNTPVERDASGARMPAFMRDFE